MKVTSSRAEASLAPTLQQLEDLCGPSVVPLIDGDLHSEPEHLVKSPWTVPDV
jgi:hypothetical protein